MIAGRWFRKLYCYITITNIYTYVREPVVGTLWFEEAVAAV